MVCPKCEGNLKVKDVVHNTDDNETYRKKQCVKCGFEIYTVEGQVAYTKRLASFWNEHARYRSDKKKEKKNA